MLLKEAIRKADFRIPFNNFYNSKPWFLLVKADLMRLLRIWYGNREILDRFLNDRGELVYTEDLVDAIDLTLMSYTWKYDHLYSIYEAKYNPIWNYEGTETRELRREDEDRHTGTDETAASGTDTTTRTGNITNTKTGNDTFAKAGSETHGKTGTESIVQSGSIKDQNAGGIQNARTTFDSAVALDTDKTTDSSNTTTTYNNKTDATTFNTTETDSFTNRTDTTTYNNTDTQTFNNIADATVHGKKDTTTYNSTMRGNLYETETTTRGGNMGTMSTQNMMEQEITVAGRLRLIADITLDIVNAICYS